MLLPGLLFVIIIVFYGILSALEESLQSTTGSGWTLAHYRQIIETREFWDSLFLSLWVTFAATLGSLIIGILTVRAFYKGSFLNRGKVMVWLPMLVPHFVAGFLTILFFSQSGWLSGLFYKLGIIGDLSQFPTLVNDRGGVGIILTYLWKEVPFVILMLLPVYSRMDNRLENVVRTLGGGSWQVFKTAEWPLLYPVVVETGLILTSFLLAAFEIPYLLGVTYPKMLPVLAYQLFYAGDWSGRPVAIAVMVLTTLLIVALVWAAFWIAQGSRYRMMRGR